MIIEFRSMHDDGVFIFSEFKLFTLDVLVLIKYGTSKDIPLNICMYFSLFVEDRE